MPTTRQPRRISSGIEGVMRTLKFGGKLDLYRRMHRLSISQLAEKVGVKYERMEDLLEAKHQPRAADVIRIMNGLNIFFEPEDFEQEGAP